MTSIKTMGQVELVWNKGIARRCDHRFPDEFPNGQDYVPVPSLAGAMLSSNSREDLISDSGTDRYIGEFDLVWVRLSWLKSFIRQVLPRVTTRFVLVTGDSDSCVPSELLRQAQTILKNSKVLQWYTQNYDGSSGTDRISPLPIGIDFHMLAEKPMWGENRTSPVKQEETLNCVRDSLLSIGHRIPQVYVDFAWQQGLNLRHYRRYHPLKGTTFHDSRRRIARKVKKNASVFCQAGPLPRTEMWRERGRYAFVLSPHGMGLDCHRTWEALALGHIVLVPSSCLNALYEDLPVIPLRSWDEINEENMSAWLARYRNWTGTSEKLTTAFWINQMRRFAKRV